MVIAKNDPVNLKFTLDSEAIKFLERETVMVSDFGRYAKFTCSVSDDLPQTILDGLPVTITSKKNEPSSPDSAAVSEIEGWFVPPRPQT